MTEQKLQKAVAALKSANFRDSEIGVVTQKHDHDGNATADGSGSKAVAGAGIGMATGAGVGTLWALGIAAAVFPPLGVVAGGTLMAVLASAAAGAAAAGLAGALIGLGVPDDEAKYFEGEIKAGRTLVTVKAGSRYDEALNLLRQSGGYDMTVKRSTSGDARVGSCATSGEPYWLAGSFESVNAWLHFNWSRAFSRSANDFVCEVMACSFFVNESKNHSKRLRCRGRLH